MQPDNSKKKNRIKKNGSIVWLTAALLAILVIATVAVAGSCLYSYANQSDCQISLYDGQVRETFGTLKNAVSQKYEVTNPVLKSRAVQYTGTEAKEQTQQSAFEVDDNTQVWKTETAIELFKAEYKNSEGTVTVKSADGSKVIAPGTEGSYTFSLKNTSDSAADYKIWVEASLSSNMTGVPIETRMTSDNGWLLGGKNSWEQAFALDGVSTAETIKAGKSAEYTIYWQWPFEQGTDAFDTDLADASATANKEMSYTVTIYTLTATATESDDPNQNNKSPVKRLLETVKTGDNTQIFLWIVVLAVATGVLLCLLIAKRRKNDEKNEHNETEQKSRETKK